MENEDSDIISDPSSPIQKKDKDKIYHDQENERHAKEEEDEEDEESENEFAGFHYNFSNI